MKSQTHETTDHMIPFLRISKQAKWTPRVQRSRSLPRGGRRCGLGRGRAPAVPGTPMISPEWCLNGRIHHRAAHRSCCASLNAGYTAMRKKALWMGTIYPTMWKQLIIRKSVNIIHHCKAGVGELSCKGWDNTYFRLYSIQCLSQLLSSAIVVWKQP